jgi:hypothetical protein
MIRGTKILVENLLTDNPHLRDDDLKLLANCYWLRVSDTMLFDLSEDELVGVKKFLKLLANGDMPNFESIRRCRQKLQEENTCLRGKLYETRHQYQETVKDDLKLF